jgi:hypothetical protein
LIKLLDNKWPVVAVCMFLCPSSGVAQVAAAPGPDVSLVLKDSSQLVGTFITQTKTQATIRTTSFEDSPLVVIIDIGKISSCSMVAPGVTPISLGDVHCTAATSGVRNGFQNASVSVGYVGSAQRDESAKGSITLAGYQALDTTGSFRGKTYLYLNAAYDDKWKATRNSSNVTQTYEGLLQQSVFARPTPKSQCSSDNPPLAYQIIGHAYHNNSQGIQVDQSYGFGILKSLILTKSKDSPPAGCSRTADPFAQRLDLSADIRSVNYFLYSPGTSDHGVGTQLQIAYSRTFRSKQVVGITLGGVPVYNRLDMSQASGDLTYLIPFNASWAVKLNVQDEYYEIAPKTFNKNYVNLSIGINFTPPKATSSK